MWGINKYMQLNNTLLNNQLNWGHWYQSYKIKRIMKEYYEELYVNKLDNLGKMDKILDTNYRHCFRKNSTWIDL